MEKIAIESPFAGNTELNIDFARNICRNVVRTGGNPYAMHLFFTQFLEDSRIEDRHLGIECGLEWTDLADEIWFCLRPGEDISSGMTLALERNTARIKPKPVLHMRLTQGGELIRFQGEDEPPLNYPVAVPKSDEVFWIGEMGVRIFQFGNQEWVWELLNRDGTLHHFFSDGRESTFEEALKKATEKIEIIASFKNRQRGRKISG